MTLAGRGRADQVATWTLTRGESAVEREADLLVEQCRRGDAGAFEELVRRHANLVVGIAYNILGNLELARDVAQEVFLKIHRNLHALEHPAKLKSWICGITRTTSIDYLRKERVKTISLEEASGEGMEPTTPPDDAGPFGTSFEREELYEKVLKVLNSLPRIYQEIILLRHLRKMSYKEMSEFLGLSPATIDSRLYRAKLLIKEKLQNLYMDK